MVAERRSNTIGRLSISPAVVAMAVGLGVGSGRKMLRCTPAGFTCAGFNRSPH
ncbi:hypothetical protein BZL30_7196 [Mycobacterium kansasii]|uniref:Uncharacterized protein n=1 Tax=Mycobacterium kansasii TaxID=1768 RepID=A0A1V3WQ13_MYCKA|nr:hypothetical protein BZL30_7196 [Mycobacterium kansasii]